MQVNPDVQDPYSGRSLLRPVPHLHQRRSLLQANKASLAFADDLFGQPSEDAHGSVLRQLRLALKTDASQLATSACLSVGQLYELETGGQRLFYSPSLRLQAARRVARLLGVDWDEITSGQVTANQLLAARASQTPDRPAPRVIDLTTRVLISPDASPKPAPLHLVPVPAAAPAALPAGVALLADAELRAGPNLNTGADLHAAVALHAAAEVPASAGMPASAHLSHLSRSASDQPLAGTALLTIAAVDDTPLASPADDPGQVLPEAPHAPQPRRKSRPLWFVLAAAIALTLSAALPWATNQGLLPHIQLPPTDIL